ncbi:hypothetical protein ACWAUC_19745 [Bradyrhizobium guangdongense]
MSTFIITVDIPGHDHSPRNHRHEIGAALDQVKQVLGSTEQIEGTITRAGGIPIGSWKFLYDGNEES